ncbi:MAG: universal stress protein [Solirubrobacterales bacterium]|nr:universal stress protein [Solirubrobacterales bacterium]
MFGSILVGTDGSDTANAAVGRAIELARDLGAVLQIVSAYEAASAGRRRAGNDERLVEPESSGGRRAEALRLLEETGRHARQAGVAAVETFARPGDSAEAIVDVARRQRAELIVVGNKGMAGARRFLLGSVPSRVSRDAPCSVLIVRTT